MTFPSPHGMAYRNILVHLKHKIWNSEVKNDSKFFKLHKYSKQFKNIQSNSKIFKAIKKFSKRFKNIHSDLKMFMYWDLSDKQKPQKLQMSENQLYTTLCTCKVHLFLLYNKMLRKAIVLWDYKYVLRVIHSLDRWLFKHENDRCRSI